MALKSRWGRWHPLRMGGGAGTPPVNSVAPVLTTDGTPNTGDSVSCSTGTWSGSPTPSYTYQWKRGGTNIASATSSSYTLQVADEGAVVKCTVTATNASGSDSADSGTITPTAPSLSYAAEVLADNPVAYWRGGITPTIDYRLVDSSSNHTTALRLWNGGGAASGFPKDAPSLLASDAASPAMDFTPDSNFWDSTEIAALNFSTAFTLECLIKPRSGALSGSVHHDIICKGTLYGIEIAFTTGYFLRAFATRVTGGLVEVIAPAALVAGTTYHVAMTMDATSLKLYVNGALVGSTTFASSAILTNSTLSFVLGQLGGSSNAYDGIMDDVAPYNTALSAARILAHHAAR